jgi:cellulose synthase/poly-beta-1,6-N-acetylglucosamine synthase-like glycosyltransferase
VQQIHGVCVRRVNTWSVITKNRAGRIKKRCGAGVALQVGIAVAPVQRAPGAVPGGRAAIDLLESRRRSALSLFPELDCVRHLLAPALLSDVERRAVMLGVGAERVLIAAGIIAEEEYVLALARHIGVPFEPLDDLPRTACPMADTDLLSAPAAGMLMVRDGNDNVIIVAPQGQAARRLCLGGSVNRLPLRVHLTTRERMQRYVDRHCRKSVAANAAHDLKMRHPENSAAHRLVRWRATSLIGIGGLAAGLALAPHLVDLVAAIFVSIVFLAWTALRVMATAVDEDTGAGAADVPDHELPVYTVIIALYREAAVVRRLVAALDAFDYPREKLDIKLVVEADDLATQAAIGALNLGSSYHVVVAPPCAPRTKPKALNAALPFARGRLTAVYDAEDRPDPDQLRKVVARFRVGNERLACVQARLTIDNTSDSWLSRLFTAEYCGQFDVLLPALAHWQLPLPLGGSSNHFSTEALRKVGAWDPYNVTEDADLGMRLARLGYDTAVVDSSTYEEAPSRIKPWVQQRTRWFKGWMQTWLVHMRAPMVLLSEMGLAGFLVFQLLVGGTVLSALVHPIFLAIGLFRLGSGTLMTSDGGTAQLVLLALYSLIFVAGYIATAVLSIIGLGRRNLMRHAYALVLVPVLWLMLSAAAWRALFQLFYAPYHWDKTEHGLAKTSRQRRRNVWLAPHSSF